MSNRKSILLMSVIAIVAIALNVLLSLRQPSASAIRQLSLLEPDFSPVHIRIDNAKDGSLVVLEKRDNWRIVKPYIGVADTRQIAKLLDMIEFAQIKDAISFENLRRLGHTQDEFVPQGGVTIELENVVGDKRTIILGELSAAKDGVYAKVSGIEAVLLLPLPTLDALMVKADEFRVRDVFNFTPETIAEVELRRPGEAPLTFTREGDVWKVDTKSTSSIMIEQLLTLIDSCEVQSFVWPTNIESETKALSSSFLSGFGLNSENAVVLTLRCIDGLESRIVLGSEANDGMVYALIDNGGIIVTLNATLKDVASAPASRFVDQRIFPLEITNVNSFSIVDDETTYAVARDANGEWRIDSPVVAKADTLMVETILGRILSLTALEMANNGLKISVNLGAVAATVNPDFLLDGLRLEDLRSREILKFDQALVRRIVSTTNGKRPRSASVVYSRERRTWNIERSDSSGIANEKVIHKLLNALSPLTALRIVTLRANSNELSRYGLEKPYHIVAIDQEQGGAVRRNILIGDETRDGRYATVGSSEAIFVISDDTVSSLLEDLVE